MHITRRMDKIADCHAIDRVQGKRNAAEAVVPHEKIFVWHDRLSRV